MKALLLAICLLVCSPAFAETWVQKGEVWTYKNVSVTVPANLVVSPKEDAGLEINDQKGDLFLALQPISQQSAVDKLTKGVEANMGGTWGEVKTVTLGSNPATVRTGSASVQGQTCETSRGHVENGGKFLFFFSCFLQSRSAELAPAVASILNSITFQ